MRKDRDVLLAYYDFPAEHWIHLRTTNPNESTFTTVRLRHRCTKGNCSRRACLTIKLMESTAKRWRLLNGTKPLPDVIAGIVFNDGLKAQVQASMRFSRWLRRLHKACVA
jgi:putative transposase